jgi:glycosyltransferase involved in cell wall biosynthesis
MMAEVGDGIDPGRVHFVGQLPYGDYLSLLQLSSVHLYFTYPFVASWSLREALATGCCIVASDTAPVREFVTSGENGILVPFFNRSEMIERILELLEDSERRAALSRMARNSARDFELNACIERFVGSFMPLEA